MALITRDEVRKIAHISAIEVAESELDLFAEELQAVLSYASSLKEIAEQPGDEVELLHTVNVMRPDQAVEFNADVLLEAAPCREDRFFVVPVIVKQ